MENKRDDGGIGSHLYHYTESELHAKAFELLCELVDEYPDTEMLSLDEYYYEYASLLDQPDIVSIKELLDAFDNVNSDYRFNSMPDHRKGMFKE